MVPVAARVEQETEFLSLSRRIFPYQEEKPRRERQADLKWQTEQTSGGMIFSWLELLPELLDIVSVSLTYRVMEYWLKCR